MTGSYRPLLVVLSLVVASAASYAALDLTGRVAAASGRTRAGWLVGGSLAMGIGIWSMHFTGMLAFRLHTPGAPGHAATAVPMLYDMRRMVLSIAVAVLASALALAAVGRRAVGAAMFGGAGLAMGAAIGGMHYIGMASLRLPAALGYRPPLVLASLAIAVGASVAALWLAFRLRDDAGGAPIARRLGAACAMGLAIGGMHYTAMAAVHFTPGRQGPVAADAGAVLATDGLAGAVVGGTLVILTLALLGAALDRRLQRRLRLAAEHERLYREAEEARRVTASSQEQLQEQAVELEHQVEEAQALAQELEQANEALQQAVTEAGQAREAAEQSAEGFRRVFAESPLPMWVYDATTLAFLNVNDAALRQYGRTREAFLAMNLREIRPPEEQPALERALASRVVGETSRVRTRHLTHDGSVLEVEVVTQDAPFAGPDRRLAIVVDVTERVRAERRQHFLAEVSRALGASLDYTAALAEVAQLAVPALAEWCSIDLARTPGDPGTLEQVAAAHAAPALVDVAREARRRRLPASDSPIGASAVVRTGRSEFYPRLDDATLAAAAHDAERLREVRQAGLHSALVVPIGAGDRVLGALTLVTAESGRRFVEADLALAEEVGRRAGLAIDNARRYAAEQAARREAEATAKRITRLQAVTAALSAPLTPAQIARVVVEQAVAMLRGQAGTMSVVEEASGDLVLLDAVGYPPEALAQFRRLAPDAHFPLTDAVRAGEPIVLRTAAEREARYPRLAALRWAIGPGAVAVIPVTLDDRRLGAIGIDFPEETPLEEADRQVLIAIAQQCAQAIERARLRDAERAARAAAEAANETKSLFLANMSHELRTPLNAIQGHVELVDMGIHGPVTDAQHEALGRVRRAQEHLLGLITDILDYAQLEAGRVRYDLHDLVLADVLRDVTELVAPLTTAKQLAYDVGLPDPAVRVRADPEKLRQVLLNLLSNAIKFTAPGGQVGIDVITRDSEPEESDGGPPSRIFVRVSDTGVGIPADKLEAVFAPFIQVESGFTRATGGTGLGLAISRDLARGMGGDLRARSQTGVGSTFTLTLPLADQP
jgi:PAS domain S-box-containing protein